MADIVSPKKRSQMMSGIKGKNTKPELIIRSGLHKLGFRFRIHDNSLPGKPDLKFSSYKAVIFVNGCFWHAHDCSLFKMPETRRDCWRRKFETNQKNDKRNHDILKDKGWRICLVWECALKGKGKLSLEEVLDCCSEWLKSNNRFLEFKGRK